MPNPWLVHLKAYHKAHPNLSYKEAMKEAKKSYKPVKKQAGGNPLLLASTLAQPVADVVGSLARRGETASNNLVAKGQLTGKYERMDDKNDRRSMKRNYQFASRMAKKYGGKLADYLSD